LVKLAKLTGGGSYKKAAMQKEAKGKKTYFAFYAFLSACLSLPHCAV